MPLMMGKEHLRAVELLQKAREAVSFSVPVIKDYTYGGVGMNTTMTASEALPIRMLFCTVDYMKGNQKIGEEIFVCGQHLQTNLVQDEGSILENEAAALNATDVVIRITDVRPLPESI
jgi:hypothetical protein